MDRIIEEYIDKIKDIDNVNEYDEIIRKLNYSLTDEYPEEFRREIEQKQKYLKNRFSDEANREKMFEAKEKVIGCLRHFLYKEKADDSRETLIKYLNNFHVFMEELTDKEPDKRATLSSEQLQMIKIKNEYDLQHLLYAVLKPIYLDIRSEVTEDSGVGMVRSDLKIPQLQVVVETKCTREKMHLKKLTEEIEADIVHYSEKNIIFFVYDKYKIIKERQSYEKYFNRTFDGKNVRIVINQPVKL